MKIQLALDKKQSDVETLVFYIKNLNLHIINVVKRKSEYPIAKNIKFSQISLSIDKFLN